MFADGAGLLLAETFYNALTCAKLAPRSCGDFNIGAVSVT